MKFKALIFDAGGVLVAPRHGEWNIPANYQGILGEKYAAEVGSKKWKIALDKYGALLREDILMPNDILKEYEMRRSFLVSVAKEMEWQLSDAQISNLTLDFTSNSERYIWYEDVEAYLVKWKYQYRIAMLSDAMPSFRSFVEKRGVSKFFDKMILSTDVGCTKPSTRSFRTIIDQLKLLPNECVFVDDKYQNVAEALYNGMFAVQMCREEHKQLWSGPIVHNFEELDRLLLSQEEKN